LARDVVIIAHLPAISAQRLTPVMSVSKQWTLSVAMAPG
jgi:hypothetical protein